MKKLICVILTAFLLIGSVTGCGQKEAGSAFTMDNEIVTYQKIDPEKTQIVVSRTGNIPVEQLCHAFEEANPNIQIIYQDITGGNNRYSPVKDWIVNGDLPDVMIMAGNPCDASLTLKYFKNLSDNPITQNYQMDALERSATDANIYWLPGPSDISAMMYNKTLFAEHGWSVPNTLDEFVSLCNQINKDTNGEIEPWNPNAKYENELMTALESITYEELFAGAENRAWINDFINGNATFKGHMEPYTEVIQILIDNNILREEHFTYSATTRSKEFSEGKIAMINMNIYDADNDKYDFGFMPYPTTKGDLGYVCDNYSCHFGIPVKEHTEKETDAINRFLEFFSSADGQLAYIGKSMKVSNVKGVPLNETDDLAALQPAIDEGHMFGRIEFTNETTGESAANLHQIAVKMSSGSMTGEQCIAEIDANPNMKTENKTEEEPPEVIAVAPQNMTILETSFYIADSYREIADAEIGLLTNNEAYRGNLMKIYAGDIISGFVEVLKPRSFANDSSLIKVSMTGQQIIDAMNNPVGNESVPNCIYAYSGLKCEVAPWNDIGTKYISVKLADGSELVPDKLYTVALWMGTVADEYITEIIETYNGTWEELMSAKIKADGTIAPADDDRITLSWE